MTAATLPAVGIDIGADILHVARSVIPEPGQPPYYTIDLAAPNWHDQLAKLCHRGSVVAYEPTGWHYSAPVVAVLHQLGCTVVQVEHRVTGMVRTLRISGVKKDITDAQALAYIAAQHRIAPLRGTHLTDPDADSRVTALRMLIWSRMRALKETTRTTNRLRQLSHSIWPTLNQKSGLYLRAVEHGYVTPEDLRGLAGSLKDGQKLEGFKTPARIRDLIALVETLPSWLEADHLREVIALEARALRDQDQRVTEVTELVEQVVQAQPFTAITDLWLTIPGGSLTMIASIHVATHGQADLLNPKQFRACLGSHPHISQSGETSESVMARQGFKPAKRDVYLWTMNLLRSSNPVRTTFEKHKARGHRHAMAAARGKLVDILSGIARNGTPYQESEAQ